jgi:WD40 repeat protein
VWDIEGGGLPEVAKTEADVEITSLSYSPDGSRLAWGETYWKEAQREYEMDPKIDPVRLSFHGGAVKVKTLSDGQVSTVGDTTTKDLTARVAAVAFSPDGQSVAAGSRSELCVWDLATGKMRSKMALEYDTPSASNYNSSGVMNALQFSADGKQLIAATRMAVARMQKEQFLRLLPNAWEITDERVVSRLVRYDRHLQLWDWQTGQLEKTLREQGTRTRAISFAPRSGQLFSGDGDGRIAAWKLSLTAP